MLRAFLFVLILLTGIPATVADGSATTVDIKEWKVPHEKSRPRDPFAVSAEEVWFVGQRTHYLAKLDVASGTFTKVDLEDGTGPHNLIVDDRGIVWFAGNKDAHIGRYDPVSEEISKVMMPDGVPRDPHTLVEDGKGNIWFTAQGANYVGRYTPATKELKLVDTSPAGVRPYGINIAPNGDAWVAMFGSNRLARLDAETLELSSVELPRTKARPRRLEATTDGRIWYVDYTKGYLGVYDPEAETFEEFLMPNGGKSYPYGMEVDAQDRLWMVATGPQPNLFIGFDPATKSFFSSTPIPSGGKIVRHMHYHEPSGTIWFGTDTNYVGRAVVEPEKFNAR